MDFKSALTAALQATQTQNNNSTRPPLPPPRRPASTSIASPRRNEHYRDASAKMLSPHVTGDNMSSARAGAMAAASRNTYSLSSSPSKTSMLPSSRASASRGTSPSKSGNLLRETLREPESPETASDGEHKWRHPNKHNEGNRKRWRETLTEDEYKRYAQWWAANRGLWITRPSSMPPIQKWAIIDPKSNPEDEVLNLVVRELWQRSRLSDFVLAEIWDLVDERKIGRLTKNQFIVGVWLIDQKLKGRKLPAKVSHSVWLSAERSGSDTKIRVH